MTNSESYMSVPTDQTPELLVESKQIVGILGVHKAKLQEFRDAGMPTRGQGKAMRYPVAACVQWFVEYRVQQETSKIAEKYQPADMDEAEAKARKLTAEALIKEVELEQLRGTLVNYKDAEKELARHLSIVRQGMLSFPARVAPFLVALKTELEARDMVTKKVNDLMQMMATQLEEPTEDADDDLDDEAAE